MVFKERHHDFRSRKCNQVFSFLNLLGLFFRYLIIMKERTFLLGKTILFMRCLFGPQGFLYMFSRSALNNLIRSSQAAELADSMFLHIWKQFFLSILKASLSDFEEIASLYHLVQSEFISLDSESHADCSELKVMLMWTVVSSQ